MFNQSFNLGMPKYELIWKLFNGECKGDVTCVAKRVYGSTTKRAKIHVYVLLNYARKKLASSSHGYSKCLALATAHVSEELKKNPEAYGRAEVMLPSLDKRGLKGEERQYVEHEELMHWLYTQVLGLGVELHAWSSIRVMHCRLFPVIYRMRRLRTWRAGGRWPPFSATCDSWNYALYLVDAVLLSFGMYSYRAQLQISRQKLLAYAGKKCNHDYELLGLISHQVLYVPQAAHNK